MARTKKRRRRITAKAHTRRRRINPPKRRRRRHVAMANPRRRRRHHTANARHTRRRHHRRNPGTSMKGVVGQVVEAGKHTAVIVVSQAATNKVAGMIPFGDGNMPMTIAKQVTVGVVLSYLARRFAPKFAGDVLIGALLAPVTSVLRMAPVIGPALAGAPPGLGLYAVDARVRTLRGAPPGLGRVGLYNTDLRTPRLNGYVNRYGSYVP